MHYNSLVNVFLHESFTIVICPTPSLKLPLPLTLLPALIRRQVNQVKWNPHTLHTHSLGKRRYSPQAITGYTLWTIGHWSGRFVIGPLIGHNRWLFKTQ